MAKNLHEWVSMLVKKGFMIQVSGPKKFIVLQTHLKKF